MKFIILVMLTLQITAHAQRPNKNGECVPPSWDLKIFERESNGSDVYKRIHSGKFNFSCRFENSENIEKHSCDPDARFKYVLFKAPKVNWINLLDDCKWIEVRNENLEESGDSSVK